LPVKRSYLVPLPLLIESLLFSKKFLLQNSFNNGQPIPLLQVLLHFFVNIFNSILVDNFEPGELPFPFLSLQAIFEKGSPYVYRAKKTVSNKPSATFFSSA